MTKTLIITEEQYRMIVEGNIDNEAPNFDGKQQEYNDSETSVTQNVTNNLGKVKRGKPITTDEFADDQITQNYWLQGVRGGRI